MELLNILQYSTKCEVLIRRVTHMILQCSAFCNVVSARAHFSSIYKTRKYYLN